MYVHVDLDAQPAAVSLEEPENCKQFHVAVRGAGAAGLDGVLRSTGAGKVLPSGDVMVDVEWLRRQAAGRVPDGWSTDFYGMLAYAGSKGWLDDTGHAIQAHVEHEDG